MAATEALSYVGFSPPAQFFTITCKHERPRRETETDVSQGLHWLPCLASLGDPKISLQIYIAHRDNPAPVGGWFSVVFHNIWREIYQVQCFWTKAGNPLKQDLCFLFIIIFIRILQNVNGNIQFYLPKHYKHNFCSQFKMGIEPPASDLR